MKESKIVRFLIMLVIMSSACCACASKPSEPENVPTSVTELPFVTESAQEPELNVKENLADIQEALDRAVQFEDMNEALNQYKNAEAKIADKQTINTISGLYEFYTVYFNLLRKSRESADWKELIQHYVNATENEYLNKDILELRADEGADIRGIDYYYADMLACSLDGDSAIVGGYANLADFFGSYADKATKENNISYEENLILNEMTSVNFHFKELFLSDSQKALEYINSYLEEQGEYYIFYATDIMLLNGQPKEAAEITNILIQYEKEQGTDKTELDYNLSYTLNWYYYCVKRGIIEKEAFAEFVDALDAKPAVVIVSILDKAAKSGFVTGDIITHIESEKVYCMAQVTDMILEEQSNELNVSVLQNGEVKIIHADKTDNMLGIYFMISSHD